jgi:hypothetical protein
MTRLYLAKLRHYLAMFLTALADLAQATATEVSDAATRGYWAAADAESNSHRAKFVAAERVVANEVHREWKATRELELAASQQRNRYSEASANKSQRILDLAR